MNGYEILETVIETYRALNSYSDKGTVSAQIQAAGAKIVDAGCQFSTNFVRGKVCNFRYQWNTSGQMASLFSEEDDNISLICSNAEGVFKRYPEEGLSTCQSLSYAVADATAVSFGGVYYSASLLMENIVPESHWFFRRLQQKKIEVVGDGIFTLTCDSASEKVQILVDSTNFNLMEMILVRPSSTIKFQWQEYSCNTAIDDKLFDQYRF